MNQLPPPDPHSQETTKTRRSPWAADQPLGIKVAAAWIIGLMILAGTSVIVVLLILLWRAVL